MAQGTDPSRTEAPPGRLAGHPESARGHDRGKVLLLQAEGLSRAELERIEPLAREALRLLPTGSAEALRAHLQLVWAFCQQGRLDEAARHMARADASVAAQNDLALRGRCRRARAALSWFAGDYVACLRELLEAERCLRDVGDEEELFPLLINLGNVNCRLGEVETSIRYLEQYREIAVARGDLEAEALALHNLSSTHLVHDDYEAALVTARRAMQLRIELGDDAGTGSSANNLGVAYRNLGDYHTAARLLYRAIDMTARVDRPRVQAECHINLSLVQRALDCSEQAVAEAQRALELFRSAGDRAGEAEALTCLGGALGAHLDWPRARESLQQALLITDELDSNLLGAEALEGLADAEWAEDHLAASGPAYERAATAYELVLGRAGQLRCLLGSARTALALGDRAEAQVLLGRATVLGEEVSSLRERTELLDVRVAVSRARGAAEDALAAYEERSELISRSRRENDLVLVATLRTKYELEQALSRADSERRRSEELMRANTELRRLHAERNDMLGMVVHDLRSPVAAIMGCAGLLGGENFEKLGPAQRASLVGGIQDSCRRMSENITSLLDNARVDAGDVSFTPGGVFLEPVVREVLALHAVRASEKGIGLELDVSTCPLARADGRALFDVVDNLVSNALKFSPPGSTVRLRITGAPGREPDQGTCARLDVTDEGPGLSEQDQTRLFGRFVRLEPRPTAGESSTGLGLYIAKSLIDAMGGHVWCESRPGHGSRFSIVLRAESAT